MKTGPNTLKTKFPKIAIIGASTCENSTGSHLQFYRLFLNYPPEKLSIICTKRYRDKGFQDKRLPGVKYTLIEDLVEIPERIYPTSKFSLVRKFQKWWNYNPYFEAYQKPIQKEIEIFKPDIILSLTMDYYWYIAYLIAKDMQLPLHLILHDRWEPHVFQKNLIEFLFPKFKEVLAYSKKRFCISPTMERFYYSETGIHSDVLYPIGNEEILSLESPLKNEEGPLKVVYFGNIWINLSTIIDLAHILNETGGELVVFSNQNIEFFVKHGLKTDNVHANGFMENNTDLLIYCRAHADVLYLPMSFQEKEKQMVQCSFPSKLTDYLSIGLPLILHAPKLSSLIEFADLNMNIPFAEVVTSDAPNVLQETLKRLSDANIRKQLGANSIVIWKKYFKAELSRDSFINELESMI